MKDAKSLDDLGRHFGGGLYEREALFLAAEELALTSEDILERHTKHHLRLTPEQRSASRRGSTRNGGQMRLERCALCLPRSLIRGLGARLCPVAAAKPRRIRLTH